MCRWCHHLDTKVIKTEFTEEEDRTILTLQKEMGNRWAHIARMMPGRTENSVKIRFKALQRAIEKGKLLDL